mmetsp:Transcript_131114/g.261672  ORF Transcript_131114/g.261672 Transcript_131114/m.261672 type:complete len:404 (-) Transcript_131114:146-1357(-)
MHDLRTPMHPSLQNKFDLRQHMEPPETVKYAVTEVVMAEGGYQKIFRYDMKVLVRFSACATVFSSGTVFTMDNNTIRTTGLVLLLQFIVTSGTLLAHIRDFKGLEYMDLEPLESLVAQVSVFVPFLLALFVSLSLSRWWALRVSALGQVFDALANTCMIVASELNGGKWREVRTSVLKYGMASLELLIQAAREAEDIESLVELDLLTESEAAFMREYDLAWQRPMVMWAWIMRVVINAMDHDKTPVQTRQELMNQCMNARDGMANINLHLDTQLPFAYVHLITLLVNVQNILMAFKAGLVFARAVPLGSYFVMIQQVFSTAIIVILYQALLTISYMITDPFGDDVLDFPIGTYKVYVASIIEAIMGASRGCPSVASDGRLFRPKLRGFGMSAHGPLYEEDDLT